MICDACSHSIFRTIKNGEYENRKWFCDVDGYFCETRLSECSRFTKKEDEVVHTPTPLVEANIAKQEAVFSRTISKLKGSKRAT